MKIAIYNHQNKATRLAQMLMEMGHQLTSHDPDLFLCDFDGTPFHKPLIENFAANGAKVVLYPHGATGQLGFDGIWEVSPQVSAFLTYAPGWREVMQIYGYPHPIHVIGWHWSDMADYKDPPPLEKVKRILFAPIHPRGDGFIPQHFAEANRLVFAYLINKVPREKISVRHYGTPDQNGIWVERSVEYHRGDLDNSSADIESADIVVSHGTFAHIALALGKPTIIYGQNFRYGDGPDERHFKYAAHWESYKDFITYPASNLTELYERGGAIREWREKFIGTPATPDRLQNALDLIFSD